MIVITAVVIATGTSKNRLSCDVKVSFPSRAMSSLIIMISMQDSVVPARSVTSDRSSIKSTSEKIYHCAYRANNSDKGCRNYSAYQHTISQSNMVGCNIPAVAVSVAVVVVVTITSRAGILSGTFSTRHSSTVPSLSRTT